ncbi:YjgN family protein [Rhizobium sp. TRM95796]|uniref:YjgN family protein n=1 Tax=Rhizobium sp. TRM95796 TaxID=2979862 RepID=UPI0021E7380A|nr:DUF898 family protein [Rhizobium sp. TRM95796]MCV3767024.1 DUF898 family protein [Rhizobium sp. TRM95796]
MQPAETSPLLKFEFRGSAREYFGIWIVNVLLTIVTLGIYSAWAKVRRLRYFYGNTVLDGFGFDYHARGKQILIGRLITFAYLVAYNVAINLSPIVGGLLGLGFLVFLPWIIVRSLRFNARVTSYRNLRFDFVGGAWGALRSFFLGGLVAGLSLGILAPFASRWAYRYVINNLRYGGKSFSTDVRLGEIYRGWLLPALMFALGIALLGVIGAFAVFPYIAEVKQSLADADQNRRVAVVVGLFYLAMLPVLLLYIVAGIVYRIGVRNIVLSRSEIEGGHRLSSAVPRFGYAWVAISNVFVTLATLSLMRPWAAVREWRYVVEHTGLQPNGELTTVVTGLQSEGSAVSSELLDIEGFDFGF